MTAQHKHSGLALLTVMMVLVIASLLAFTLTERLQRQVSLSSGLENRDQAWWYHLSAEQQALKALDQAFKDDKSVVHIGQIWAKVGQSFALDQGVLSGTIYDRQSCFNLNSLTNYSAEKENTKRPVQVLKALLENYQIDNLSIADGVRDWVHPDTQTLTQEGADDNDYLALPVSYLAGNTLMRDESELRAVFGVSPGVAKKLLPVVCAIPETEFQMNVNTLPVEYPELLAALFLNRLSIAQAEDILQNRPQKGWRTVDQFLAEELLSNTQKDDLKPFLTVNSHYFELDSRVQVGAMNSRMRSLLVRDGNDALSVVRRRSGETL